MSSINRDTEGSIRATDEQTRTIATGPQLSPASQSSEQRT